jgi:transcriptional regulator with XRE-family HTH domain
MNMQITNKPLVTVNATRLAKELGVTRSTIHRWSKGISKPTRRHRRMLEAKLGKYFELILPDHEDQQGPTQEENEDRFRQTAQLVADGWLPPEHTYKGETSRTPFDEGRFREIAKDIAAELRDSPQN